MSAERSPRLPVAALLGVLAAPYLLNDFANLYVHAPALWLACDHGSRLLSIATIVWLLRRGEIGRADLQMQGEGRTRIAAVTLVVTAAGVAFHLGPGRFLLTLLPHTQMGWLPPIHPAWLQRLDYVVGIAVVAVTEEVVFRGLFPRLLARAGIGPAAVLAGSAVAFGLIHWSLGAGVVLHAVGLGLLFGIAVRVGRSVWPVVVAHYAVDLVAFG